MKKASVIGDSISTYEGYNPEGYLVHYTSREIERNSLTSVGDTWWMRVIDALGAELLVNGSYSGSLVTGDAFPAAASFERIDVLKGSDSSSPDIILVYIGVNDFLSCIPVGIFTAAYAKMLSGLKKMYPDARIICATLAKAYCDGVARWLFSEQKGGVSLKDYNESIRKVCMEADVTTADIAASGLIYETLDGIHPTRNGHKKLADTWLESLKDSIHGS